MSAAPKPTAGRSLAEYLVRYDLPTALADAHREYDRPTAAGPRLLNQTEIAARFRKRNTAKRDK